MTQVDGTEQINVVTRRVGNRTFRAGEARAVVIGRTYDASLEDVWEACTSPDRIRRWFLPVSGELREGGRYQVQGNAGGVIERCEPPRSFAATWEFGGQVSWIELRLSEAAEGRIRLELEHIAHVDDHWAQFGPGAVGVGWDLALLGLTRHLTTGAAVDPQTATMFPASEEGRAFIEESSRGWCEAAIAAGADSVEATAAADRVYAFFTGTGTGPA